MGIWWILGFPYYSKIMKIPSQQGRILGILESGLCIRPGPAGGIHMPATSMSSYVMCPAYYVKWTEICGSLPEYGDPDIDSPNTAILIMGTPRKS